MKAYTDLEQSKKLAEILSLESADMSYTLDFDSVKYEISTASYKSWIVPKYAESYKGFNQVLPCWSLAALLSVIPKHIKDYNILRIDIGNNDFAIWYDEIGYGVNDELPNITKESAVDVCYEIAVDACYEMIIKLKERNLI